MDLQRPIEAKIRIRIKIKKRKASSRTLAGLGSAQPLRSTSGKDS